MFQKELMARAASHITSIVLVNEFPKSGGTWLKHMLSERLGLPPWTKGKPVWNSCVLQGHWLRPRGNCHTVVLFRDGRDVMVSLYFHSFFLNEFRNGPLVEASRARFRFDDYHDVRNNLLPFMRGIDSEPISPRFTWTDFVDAWARREGIVFSRYEDLREDPVGELERIVANLTGEAPDPGRSAEVVARYTLDAMRSRKTELNPNMTGQQDFEVSFLRTGSVGGWSEVFTDEALGWFEARHGNALSLLGYKTGLS